MRHKIVRNIRRPDPDMVKQLGQLGVATVHEAMDRAGGLMHPYMRPIYPSARLAGPAITVLGHPGDNMMTHAAVDVAKPGDVLVVACMAETFDGGFGELLATCCQARGIAGVILDTGVRDVAELTAMNFPVWAKAISAMGTVKATAGSVNVDIVCAGALVRPGDAIIADLDGVVAVPREAVPEILKFSKDRQQKEAAARERYRAGELGMDMHGLRAKLKELGVEYEEGTN